MYRLVYIRHNIQNVDMYIQTEILVVVSKYYTRVMDNSLKLSIIDLYHNTINKLKLSDCKVVTKLFGYDLITYNLIFNKKIIMNVNEFARDVYYDRNIIMNEFVNRMVRSFEDHIIVNDNMMEIDDESDEHEDEFIMMKEGDKWV